MLGGISDVFTQLRRQRTELWVLDVGDGALVGRVCRILGYGIGLADVIILCDLHYILSSVPEIRLTLKASSARKLLELRVQSCTGFRGPPGAPCSRNLGDQAPVVKSADTATLKVAALGHAGSRPAGGTRSRTGDPVFLRPAHPAVPRRGHRARAAPVSF